MDLTTGAPEGAGWYIDIISDQQRLMEPMPVPPETAYQLAQDFARAMQDSEHELPTNFTPQALVQTGSQGIYAAIKKQLDYAEEQASRIAVLRKKLTAIPMPPPTSSPYPILTSDETRQER